MQNIIVILIVTLAGVLVGWRFIKTFLPGKKTSCGCGCYGCSDTPTCSSSEKSSS